ncbi:MAG: purine-nucleoside phosphorylase, partial [Candidatus Marinimicrobia bacterium]|nr:purine-nucleoside phosphorylase [Candidatus Neomarinimicrobiota bacterium]
MADYVGSRSGFTQGVAVILGSGLGGFAEQIQTPIVISYHAIPNYPQPTVEGHRGEFVIGNYKSVPLIAAKGRFHYYEGHDIETVTLPIQLFHKLGVKYIIITNAAGSVRKSIPPGTLMAISGYMDCTFRENLFTPQVIDDVSSKLLGCVEEASKKMNVKLNKGIYCWTQGPAYETPAEIEFIRNLKGDAVGMSTVPELQAAKQLGIEALGISTITNYAAGILDQPLTHNEVIETANRTKNDFAKLVGATIENIGELL